MSPDPLTTLGTADRNALEALLVEFDLNWGPDRFAIAVEQLPPGGRLRTAGLRELVRIDMERHARHGSPVTLDEYAARYPELLETGVGLSPPELGGDEPTPHMPASAGPPKLPEHFGRYHILRPLGRGGMGSVFLARDAELDRLVALKVPHFRPDDPSAGERFAREAKAAATIDHPNVCQVYDVGRIDGIQFLTMAYVDGRTLSDEMRAAPLSPRRAVEVVREVARGMAEAHRLGVVHRDLKPGNVLMAPDGRPVVTDFGLARRNADDLRLTSSGTVLGTPLYMAPEQVAGDTGRIGPASDVYALGVVLYELLAGRPPFGLDRTEIMAGTLSHDPPPPSSVRRDVDPRLDAVVLKAMAKRSTERPNMTQLADALDAWLTDAKPRPARRSVHRWLVGAAVAVVLLLLLPAGVKLGWFGGPRGPGPEEKKIENGTKGDPNGVVGERKAVPKEPVVPRPLGTGTFADAKFRPSGIGFTPDSQKVLLGITDGVVADVLRFDALTGKDESVKMDRLLKGFITFSADGRRFMAGDGGNVTDLRRTDTGAEVKLFVTGPHSADGAVAHDAPRVVIGGETIGGDPFARVCDTNTGDVVGKVSGHAEKVQIVAISDDGTWAYSVSPDRDALWEVKTGRAVVEGKQNTIRCATFIPKTTWCAVGNAHGDIAVFDAAKPTEVLRYTDRHKDTVTCLTATPDGQLLLSGSMDQSIRPWDPAKDRLIWQLPNVPGVVTALAVSPDGKRLAAAFADRTWRVWELAADEGLGPGPEEKKLEQGGGVKTETPVGGAKAEAKAPTEPRAQGAGVLNDPNDRLQAVGFSHDGKQVYTAAQNKARLIIRRWDAATGVEEKTPMKPLVLDWAVFSPDGRRVLVGGGMKYTDLLRASDGERLVRFDTGSQAAAAALSRDGQLALIAVNAFPARLVRVYDAATGQPAKDAAVYAAHGKNFKFVALSDDGRWAYSVSPDRETVWDVKTGKPAFPPGNGEPVRAATFIPGTSWIASANAFGQIAVLDMLKPNEFLHYSNGHEDTVTCLAATPDGKLLLSGGDDQAIRAWHTARNEQKWALTELPAKVKVLAVSPDGKRLVAGFADRSWKVWELPAANPPR